MLFVFLFRCQYFCHCAHFHKFLLRAYSSENISQSCNLKNYSVFPYFLLEMRSLFMLAPIVFFVKMTSHCLNPNLVLNLCDHIVIHSIISLIAKFLSLKIPLHYFLYILSSSCLCFLWFQRYFNAVFCKILRSNSSSLRFSCNHNVPHYLILCLCHLFHMVQDFSIFLSSHYIFSTHYLLKQTVHS